MVRDRGTDGKTFLMKRQGRGCRAQVASEAFGGRGTLCAFGLTATNHQTRSTARRMSGGGPVAYNLTFGRDNPHRQMRLT